MRKLGLKPGVAAVVIGAPGEYGALLAVEFVPPEVQVNALPVGLGFLHLFTVSREEMALVLTAALATMARDGMIWVSWPKKSAGVLTDITEDGVRAICLPMGLVDVKVCAVTEVWSGLKLVIRKELR